MKTKEPGDLIRYAGNYMCVGCGEGLAVKDGLFIYHRPDNQENGWGGYVSHLNPTCICKTFAHYMTANGFDPVETMIALDTAVREMRDAKSKRA